MHVKVDLGQYPLCFGSLFCHLLLYVSVTYVCMHLVRSLLFLASYLSILDVSSHLALCMCSIGIHGNSTGSPLHPGNFIIMIFILSLLYLFLIVIMLWFLSYLCFLYVHQNISLVTKTYVCLQGYKFALAFTINGDFTFNTYNTLSFSYGLQTPFFGIGSISYRHFFLDCDVFTVLR